jgi:hypothetical protein
MLLMLQNMPGRTLQVLLDKVYKNNTGRTQTMTLLSRPGYYLKASTQCHVTINTCTGGHATTTLPSMCRPGHSLEHQQPYNQGRHTC